MQLKTSQTAWTIPFILLFPLMVFSNTAEYKELKRKWESARSEELALEKTCKNPDAPCALTLSDIRANRKSLEKKLKAKEKTLKAKKTALEAKRAADTQIKNPEQAKKITENKKNLKSSIKKVRKQQKTLRISALINAGVGGYLLLNHCKPPAKKVGCVLGPLALSQAYIHYNQSKKMNKTANNLSKITPLNTNSGALQKINQKSDENNNPETENPQLIVNGKPISEVTFPCPGGKEESSCVLEEDGTTIRSTSGNSISNVSELAGIKPTGKEAKKAMSNALKKQKPLLEAVKKMDPQFNPVSNLNPTGTETASVPFIANGDLGEGSLGGNTPPSSSTAIIPHAESGKDSSGEKNNFPFVGDAPENAGNEGDYYSGGYEEDIEEEAEEPEEDIEEEVQKLLDKFGGNKNKKKADAATKKPLPFGTGEKISQSGRSILNVIRERYQNYRSRGEFIHIKPKKSPNTSK